MNAIGYVRVSTEEQATEGVSLDAQRAKIAAYCDLNGLTLTEVFSDEGVSGKDLAHRPGALRALDLVRAGRVDALVVYSLSRLARSTRDCLDVADLARRKRCALHSITEKIDTESPAGGFFFRLLASMAEMERDTIAHRTRDAMQHKAQRNEYCGGFVPFGRDLAADGRTLTVNSAEQVAVDLVVELHRRGYSLRAIARELESRGIRPKAGTRWAAVQVKRVLDRAA